MNSTYKYVAKPKRGNSRILEVNEKVQIVYGDGAILGDIVIDGKMLSIDASQPTKDNQQN
jgi:hypothetical protein